MNHSDLVPKYLHGQETEIGAFKTPIPGIQSIQVDRFAEYANERTIADYYGEASDLPFRDSSLDYVASSHVLEHSANPAQALWEWVRVLRHQGIIYVIVPDRRLTFDHPRPLTSVSHMIDDFRAHKTQSDGTHVEEFVFGVDWPAFSPGTPAEKIAEARQAAAEHYRHAVAENKELNIHFHTFELATLRGLVEEGNRQGLWPAHIEILETAESFPSDAPNGILLVGRVHKPLSARIKTYFCRKGLKPTAVKFS